MPTKQASPKRYFLIREHPTKINIRARTTNGSDCGSLRSHDLTLSVVFLNRFFLFLKDFNFGRLSNLNRSSSPKPPKTFKTLVYFFLLQIPVWHFSFLLGSFVQILECFLFPRKAFYNQEAQY